MDNINRIKEQINFCIRSELWAKLPELLDQLHPADIADVIRHSSDDAQIKLFDLLSDETKADVYIELDDTTAEDILEDLTVEEISDIIEEMAPDDAADLLGDLEKERSEEVLDLMPPEESEEVRELLSHDKYTAGGIMTTDLIALPGTKTAAEAIEHVGSLDLNEPFYLIYVIDVANHLIGYVQLWQLLRTENRHKTLAQLAETALFTAQTDTDQEEVARIMSKYDLTSLPVVDAENRLVGRVTVDDMVDVIEEEASEDIFKLAGSDNTELKDPSPFASCQARLPWLFITLFSGFVTSMILKGFMHSISMMEVLALSFFVPIVMGMGGNTGIQSSTLIIRGLALGTFSHKTLRRMLLREMSIGMMMGIICGTIIGLWARFVISTTTAFHPVFLAFCVGAALFSAMTFAAVFGAAVPLVLNHFKIDPAVASGPFVSASNDITALLIYYGVTFALISPLI
ncbi:MAG: magnesium transporter [Kiritimatiellales bacterium]